MKAALRICFSSPKKTHGLMFELIKPEVTECNTLEVWQETTSPPKSHKRGVLCIGLYLQARSRLKLNCCGGWFHTRRPIYRSHLKGIPDSLPDSSPADEYRVLRKNYLLLESNSYAWQKRKEKLSRIKSLHS